MILRGSRAARRRLGLSACAFLGVVLYFWLLSPSVSAAPARPCAHPGPELATSIGGIDGTGEISASDTITNYLYFPLVASGAACPPIAGESYGTITVNPPPTDRPAESHPDLNLALRGYVPTTEYLGLVDYDGPSGAAPQLAGLFGDNRLPRFSAVYRVYDWDWTTMSRGDLIDAWPVTLAGLETTAEEVIHVPDSGYDIGWINPNYEVLVLYASDSRITLKYTRDDNVKVGYTIHLENICVEPNLLALYQAMNNAGRSRLPALFAGQGVGRAKGTEIGVAIRDTGSFMDPRSRKDWWQGK